jgi:parallel beta-helix repeat protein
MSIKFLPLLLTIFSFLYINNISPATYYVDTNGNDSNSGLSPASAWKTIAKINSQTFSPGDQILFKSGRKWREQLNIPSSGSAANPIRIGSYDPGNQPVISGADIITGFVLHSGNIWKRSSSRPRQVFFNEIRGKEMTSVAAVDSAREWFYDGPGGVLYVYSAGNPAAIYPAPGIEAAIRQNCIYTSQDYITIENFQLEKTSNSAIKITADARNIIMNNLILYQWTSEPNWEGDGDGIPAIGGIDVYGSGCEIKNSTFGKNTGNDLADQNWAGFVGIHVTAANTKIINNNFFHNAIENDDRLGNRAYTIRLSAVGGLTEIAENYFYHNGSHAILVRSGTRAGDTIKIHDNLIEYSGQAGISCYVTRRLDGIGGVGYIYKNEISFANRLGGDIGGAGNQAASIHLNDGGVAGTDPARPYMKWYVYDNVLHNAQAIKKPNGQDSDGIGIDFNANEAEVFRNLIFNNWGKGIYMWNANRCKVYYNIIYGNDAGTTVTAATGTVEKADNNIIYNNTYYKNYNTDAYGPNYNCELYFGGNGKNNLIKNNIFYGHDSGVVYTFRDVNTNGCITDNNVIYKDGGSFAYITESKYFMPTFAEWCAVYPQWDANSVYADPELVNANGGNFDPGPASPALNRGVDLGFTTDFYQNPLRGIPDIGAVELQDFTPPVISSADRAVILLDAMNGTLSGDARLGSMTGMRNTRAVYFQGTSGGVTFNINIPKTGGWYAWARMYYMSSGGKNSFFLGMNSSQFILGDNNSKYNQWHWDGYIGNKISLGTLNQGNNTLKISGREPGLTLWVDQIVITNDPNYIPSDEQTGYTNFLFNAMEGTLSGDARLGSMTGMKNTRAVYFQGTNGGVTFNINIPKTGQWYAWARMYYMSSGGKNSFFLNMNSSQFILGDNDSKYNQWHWDGYLGNKISLGNLNAGSNTLRISGREPGLTLWVDQIVITNNPDYVPNDNQSVSTVILFNGLEGTLSGDARLGSMTGMKNSRAVYFQGTSGGVTFNVNIPATKTWYAWARMYYMNSGGKNSFFLNMNSSQYILGDNDLRYNQWHWDGYIGNRIDLGMLNAGSNTLRISGREPGLTLWVDQVVITDDPNYNPNIALGKENSDEEFSQSLLPREFDLSQNYPNPFNPSTNFRFSIPADDKEQGDRVVFKIFDILGNEVAVLINEFKQPGVYEVQFNAAGLSSGIYFARLQSGNKNLTRKMILMK